MFYKQAYQLWEKLGNFTQLVGLCNNLGVLDHLTGDYLEAFSWFSKALEYGRQSSNLLEPAFALASLADLALDLGALSRAEDYINQSFVIAEEIGDAYLQIYLQLSLAALSRKMGEINSAREHLDAVAYRIKDYPSGTEMGKYHLENGFLLMEEGLLDQAYLEFQAAREIFSDNNLPVETCLALVHLARINCLRGKLSEAALTLNSLQEIIQSLGTIQPLIPTFSGQKDLLNCLEGTYAGGSF